MDIGRMDKRITFYTLQNAKDELGQEVQKLAPYKTVWASLYPIRGTEMYEIQKVQGKTTHKCYVRYLKGIDSNAFIRHGDTYYSIESVLDVGLEHKTLEILCTDHVNKEELDRE